MDDATQPLAQNSDELMLDVLPPRSIPEHASIAPGAPAHPASYRSGLQRQISLGRVMWQEGGVLPNKLPAWANTQQTSMVLAPLPPLRDLSNV